MAKNIDTRKHPEVPRDMIVPNGAHAATVVAAHALFSKASREEQMEIVRTVFKPASHARRLRDFADWLDKLEAGDYRRPDLSAMDLLEGLYGRVGIMASDAGEAFGLRGEVEAFWAAVDGAREVKPGTAAPEGAGPGA